MIQRAVFFLLFIGTVSNSSAKVCIVVLPLHNPSTNYVHQWIGAAIPDLIVRFSNQNDNLQVWDPEVIMSADSMVAKNPTDSILLNHQSIWKWDCCITGSYAIGGDSMRLVCTVNRVTAGTTIQSKSFRFSTTLNQSIAALKHLALQVIRASHSSLATTDSLRIDSLIPGNMKAYEVYCAGYHFVLHQKPSHAIAAFDRSIEMDDDLFIAFFQLGMLYYKSKNREKALHYAQNYFEAFPLSSCGAALVLRCFIDMSEQKKADAFIEKQKLMLERSVCGLNAIAYSYMAKKNYQRAIAILTRALSKGPTDLETDFLLGTAYMKSAQYPSAIDIFNKLISCQPNHSELYILLGQAYTAVSKNIEAYRIFEYGLSHDSLNTSLILLCANAYVTLGWYDKALWYCQTAYLNGDSSPVISLVEGIALSCKGNNVDAKKMFARALESPLTRDAGLCNLASIFEAEGEYTKALELYKKVDTPKRNSREVLFNLARLYTKLGKIKQSIQCYEQIIAENNENVEALLLLSHNLCIVGKYSEAEIYGRKAWVLSPGDSRILNCLLTIYKAQNNYEEAIRLVDGYLEQYPQDRYYLLQRPELYCAKGWYQVAVELYKNLLKEKGYDSTAAVYVGIGKALYGMIARKISFQYDLAIYYLKSARTLDPLDPTPDELLAILYGEYKHYPEQAVEYWNAALQKTADPRKQSEIKLKLQEYSH